ncbi:hypothetical protein [Kitasatospora sp. NPDC092286]|uniref:hypothetical protein n=1 Tax=Kitasatospora sp. NPDC092286 TaxID=3364087 RepID=UPI0038042F71
MTRSHGSGRSLFQSDLLHNETVSLFVREATRGRDLNHDWVHPGRELVEIEMSLAQWGSLVSSMGLGSGVPVTIRSTERDAFLPEIPHQPRTAENLREVREVTDRMYVRVKEATAALHDAIHAKKGVRATKEALNALENAVAHVGSNAQFAVDSLVEAGEQVVAQARADIEAHVLEVVRVTGAAPSIEAPPFGAPALPEPVASGGKSTGA